jgi:glycosyltransferase involved in cell wall biosynthesis
VTQTVKISIIIPNLHSPIVDKTIESVLAQKTDLSYEVLVVGMDKWGLVDRFSEKIHFIKSEQPIPPGAARNLGVVSATGEYIFFIDSDCIASPEWIEMHFALHQETDQPIIVGGGVDFPSKNYFTLADNISWFHEFMVHIQAGAKIILPSLNLSLSRTIWNMVGGFNHNPAGEDTDFSLRALSQGVALVFSTKPLVVHLPSRRKLRDLFQHAYVFGLYSSKANRSYWHILNVPFPLRNSYLTILLSPLLAIGVVYTILFREKLPLRYWHTLPVVYLIKLVWCFGYAKQLRTKRVISNE